MKLEIDISSILYNDAKENRNYISLNKLEIAWKAIADGKPLEQEPTTKNNLGVDCISRTRAIERLKLNFPISQGADNSRDRHRYMQTMADIQAIREIPSVTPQEPKIVSIAEIKYDKDKLKELMNKAVLTVTPQEPRWIPVSEKLPNDRDWYLGIFKESDTGWINPLPFICDYVGSETKATTKEYWILRGFTDRDEHIDYYFNLECVAWMPLPEPCREVEE